MEEGTHGHLGNVIRRIAIFGLCLAGACSSSGQETPRAVTWHQDVAPLVAEKCVTCHQDEGIAYFSMQRYADALPFAASMALAAEERSMPPWGPQSTDECEPQHPWRHDRSLSEEQIGLIRSWVDQGAPEGDPMTAAPLPPVPDFVLSDATLSVTPKSPYRTGGFFDELQCFIVDPGNSEDLWVTGTQFTPGNDEVVHHTVAVVVPPEATDALRQRAGEDETYPCFGSLGVEAGWPVGGWVPGVMPFLMPEDVGVPLPAGSLLMMQIHYHPVGPEADPDLTTIHLRTTNQEPARRMSYLGYGNAGQAPLLQPGPNDRGDPEFRVPANASAHTETIVASFESGTQFFGIDPSRRYPVFGVFPHMHYIGVELKATIERAASNECLLEIPGWDFDWQDRYFYDAAIEELPTIGPGDTVRVQCGYDNTLANPFVQRALTEQGLSEPTDVLLGDGTLDEMCWLGMYVID
jgi:hypothetical protein